MKILHEKAREPSLGCLGGSTGPCGGMEDQCDLRGGRAEGEGDSLRHRKL